MLGASTNQPGVISMADVEARLAKLERTVSRQRLVIGTITLGLVIAVSAGAMKARQPAETVRAKELIIEDAKGGMLGYLGPDNGDGVSFALVATPGNEKRFIKLSVRSSGAEFSSGFDDEKIIASAGKNGSAIAIGKTGGGNFGAVLSSVPKSGGGLDLNNPDGSKK